MLEVKYNVINTTSVTAQKGTAVIMNLRTRWMWMVSFELRPLYIINSYMITSQPLKDFSRQNILYIILRHCDMVLYILQERIHTATNAKWSKIKMLKCYLSQW